MGRSTRTGYHAGPSPTRSATVTQLVPLSRDACTSPCCSGEKVEPRCLVQNCSHSRERPARSTTGEVSVSVTIVPQDQLPAAASTERVHPCQPRSPSSAPASESNSPASPPPIPSHAQRSRLVGAHIRSPQRADRPMRQRIGRERPRGDDARGAAHGERERRRTGRRQAHPRLRPDRFDPRRGRHGAGRSHGLRRIRRRGDRRQRERQIVAEHARDERRVVGKGEAVVESRVGRAAAARQLRCERERPVRAIRPVGVLAVGRVQIPARSRVIVRVEARRARCRAPRGSDRFRPARETAAGPAPARRGGTRTDRGSARSRCDRRRTRPGDGRRGRR